MKRAALVIALAAFVAAAPAGGSNEHRITGDAGRASRARDAITELDVKAGRAILEGADPADPALALERARLAIYEGDYDTAAQILSRSDLAATQEGAELVEIARGCARSMAGALVIVDEARGVQVRLQDDDDGALAPLLTDVAVKVREMLIKDLGVELPKPPPRRRPCAISSRSQR